MLWGVVFWTISWLRSQGLIIIFRLPSNQQTLQVLKCWSICLCMKMSFMYLKIKLTFSLIHRLDFFQSSIHVTRVKSQFTVNFFCTTFCPRPTLMVCMKKDYHRTTTRIRRTHKSDLAAINLPASEQMALALTNPRSALTLPLLKPLHALIISCRWENIICDSHPARTHSLPRALSFLESNIYCVQLSFLRFKLMWEPEMCDDNLPHCAA